MTFFLYEGGWVIDKNPLSLLTEKFFIKLVEKFFQAVIMAGIENFDLLIKSEVSFHGRT